MVPVLCAEPVPLTVPLVLVLVLFSADVFEAVGALFVVEGDAEFEVGSAEPVAVPKSVLGGRESVIVTGIYTTSVGSRVVVDIPGSFASSPPKDSVQTADPLVRVQSI